MNIVVVDDTKAAPSKAALFFDYEQTFRHTGEMQDENEIKIEPEVDAEGGDLSQRDAESDESTDVPERRIAKMREELKSCRVEKQEYMDGWQRAKADYVNLLKRLETDAKASEFKGKVGAVEMLLPAFDALERAKEHGDVPEGFAGIAKQLETAFAELGLQEIGVIGEHFNPALHEALGQDAAETLETDDTVTVVLEKGWRVADFIIRPAKVRVGHFASEKKEA